MLCGGTRLEDIERLRHDVAFMNAVGADLIPDPTTAGDFCRRFAEADVAALMEAINAVRLKLWAGRGRELLGPENVREVPPIMGGEDFAYYAERIPGCFVGLGILDEEVGAVYSVHHPKFKVDEAALPIGSALHVAFALQSLAELRDAGGS